jgi:hypothetical protein
MPLEPTSVKIPEGLRQQYQDEAKSEGVSQSELMRRALIDWIRLRRNNGVNKPRKKANSVSKDL